MTHFFFAFSNERMIDMMVCVGVPMLFWTSRPSLTGFPLIFAMFALLWLFNLFPSSMSAYDIPSPRMLVTLVIATDIVQTCVHVLLHARMLGDRVFRAHQIHHRHSIPTPDTAFETGVMDAVLQVVAPVYGALHVVRPDRSTAILFGCIYSQWLMYIHSSLPDHSVPFLVSPSYHKAHHTSPHKHFAHVLRIA